MAAFVRVSGPPNSNFLVGYPGISATLPRIEGKVEVRPLIGVSAPVAISLVTIALQRRESIHPAADSVTKKHLAAPRKEIVDIVGKEMLLYRSPLGREAESILAMDLPFVIFIPYGRGGEEIARRVPPASLQLPSRTAETYYELVVTVQQGAQEQKKYAFPVPIARYDTLSTFGMYNRPESAERVSDHLVTLGISLPRWSYGPLDPVSVYIKLSPNPDWMAKAKKVTIQKITVGIDEEIIYNHEGDEPTRKAQMSAAKDILLRQPIVVCPFDHAGCKQEMEAIEQAAKDAAHVSPDNPMLPAAHIVKATDPMGLAALGMAYVGGQRKPLID
ncbi:Arrestin family protein 1 [Neofusicoccum parvum]|uniref:Arrestin family protein 1 n=2 Tax=Neofusicoccum parvum TaxID=310453 RepID=A0ACB5RXW2_9PEZI|nr:putative arrestin domain protein [Neofusicoccum parvum UCRNP2]GME24961.1 Arrestin family protein 1 [Neofusicoccum parvum]GME66239.1 Arrestin family protein 1 [Neofusicoccum parvum]